jgi:hypothetical protein
MKSVSTSAFVFSHYVLPLQKVVLTFFNLLFFRITINSFFNMFAKFIFLEINSKKCYYILSLSSITLICGLHFKIFTEVPF